MDDQRIADLERENAQLRVLLGASLKDTAQLDWLGDETTTSDRMDRVEAHWYEGTPLREAIDNAMRE